MNKGIPHKKRPVTWCHMDQEYVAHGLCVKCYPQTRREQQKASLRKSRFKASLRKYELTSVQYQAIFDSQGGLCGICAGELVGREYFCLDHDHKTNKPRGLLCTNCNAGIGMFKDEPKRLIRAAEYLEKYS